MEPRHQLASFNGAADRYRRRVTSDVSALSMVEWLQRSRRSLSAESLRDARTDVRAHHASTEPPIVIGGELLKREELVAFTRRFNGAADRYRRRGFFRAVGSSMRFELQRSRRSLSAERLRP